MRKWRLICHTSRKEDESIEKQALDWNPLGARRRRIPKQRGKGPFCRKQENEVKRAVMLIKILASNWVSEGASQVPCVPNGAERYTVTMYAVLRVTCCNIFFLPRSKTPVGNLRRLHKFEIFYTRVGTLIMATVYLQLIQNRYMFRSFTVLQCSHQHCVQPVASDVEVVGYL